MSQSKLVLFLFDFELRKLNEKVTSSFFPDSEKPPSSQDVADPTGPAARKGVLISFRTGKTMEIPEKDIVRKLWHSLLFIGYVESHYFFTIHSSSDVVGLLVNSRR